MPDENRIEEGDVVVIYFSHGDAIFDAEVLYTPAATGDAWRVHDKYGDLYYIQTFETMKLIRKGATSDHE